MGFEQLMRPLLGMRGCAWPQALPFKAPKTGRAPTKALVLGRKVRESPAFRSLVTFKIPRSFQVADPGLRRVWGHTKVSAQSKAPLVLKPQAGLSSMFKLWGSGWELELFWGLRFRSSSKPNCGSV